MPRVRAGFTLQSIRLPAPFGRILFVPKLQAPPIPADLAIMVRSARRAEFRERRQRAIVPPAPEVVESARAAGLRYVNDATVAGLGRRRKGKKNFTYFDADGRAVTDAAVVARIRSLAIPPAWEEVWICPFENGHLQATGKDARGRKQYRYHPRFRQVRDQTKYEHMID